MVRWLRLPRVLRILQIFRVLGFFYRLVLGVLRSGPRGLSDGGMGQSATPWTSLTHISEHCRGQEGGLSLSISINCLLNQLVPAVEFSTPLLHLSLDGRLKAFAEKADQVRFFWGPVTIKFQKNGLEMFQSRGPILNFFHLILGVSSNSTPDTIDKGPGVSEVLPGKSLKVDPGYGHHCLSLGPTLMLLPVEINPTTKER